MELNAKQAEFTALVTNAIGRQVEVTEKGTDVVHVFGIKGLDEKIGTMKDGTKVGYTVLERDDNGTLVVTAIHPNIIAKLLKNGSEAGMVLRPIETEEVKTDVVAEVAPVKAETAPEVADELVEPVVNTATTETAPVETPAETTAAASAEAPAEAPAAAPSKKQQCVAIYKTMSAAGKARKDVIAEFTSKVGLSAAGANTYYQNCKSGAWA